MINSEFLLKLSAVLATYEVRRFPIDIIKKVEKEFSYFEENNNNETVTAMQFLTDFISSYSECNSEGRELEMAEKVLAEVLRYCK
jgi:hypothetical protein